MTSNEKSNSVLKVFDNMATEYVEYFGDDWEFINEIKEFASQFKENSVDGLIAYIVYILFQKSNLKMY